MDHFERVIERDTRVMTQGDLRELYMQEVEGRLHLAAERMARDALDRTLALHPGRLAPGAFGQALAYTLEGGDPISNLVYRQWLTAHLSRIGWRAFVDSNPPSNRRLMGDRLPLAGDARGGESLMLRLTSADPMVRGTALGDLARGWA